MNTLYKYKSVSSDSLQNKTWLRRLAGLAGTLLFLLISLLMTTESFAQNELEMASGSVSNTAVQGPVASWPQAMTLLQNTTGTTYVPFSPPVSVSVSLSNQAFTAVTGTNGVANGTGNGIVFGGTITTNTKNVTPINIYTAMNRIGGGSSTPYTSGPNSTTGQGIDATTNFSTYLFTSTEPLSGSALGGRFYYGNVTVTFSRPVDNPLLHFVGLGGAVNGNGFTSEFEYISSTVNGATANTPLARLSGSTEFALVSAGSSYTIANTASTVAAVCGSGAACGTIKVSGNQISSISFRVYLRGDGKGTAWTTAGANGDSWLLGVSLRAPSTLSGTVFDDGNGGTVDGTGTNAGGTLYANLVSGTAVVGVTSIPSSGTYSFGGLFGGIYSAIISTTAGTVGNSPPASVLPSGWISTGEGVGPTPTTTDGTADGIVSVTVPTSGTGTANDVPNVNFGIEQLPTATSTTLASQVNPGGINGVTIPPASFTGTDPDGTINNIHYTAFPSNVTSMTIGNTIYVASLGVNLPVGAVVFPNGGVTAVTGTTVRIDPTDGAVTVAIPFRVIDNLGQESTNTGTASVPFTGLSVSGTVFDDGNGLTDGQVNGTGTNVGGIFANLVDATGNVVAFQSVPTTGVYSFSGISAGAYSVRLSTTTVAVGSAAPATSVPTGWTFTGEGTAAAGDGTPNGSTLVTLTTTSVSGVNFGLDQLPVPTSLTISGQPNPGGTIGVVVPPASFTGTDADGTIAAVRYVSFPTNVNSFTIGTTVYTSANFPAGGVTATSGTAIAIDPVDGNVTANIPFRVIDNAGQEGTTTGTVGVPFLTVTDFCNSQILFFNEDFGAGVSFGPPLSTTTVPGYTYQNTDPVDDGYYATVNNPDQADDFATRDIWLHGPDHTGNPNGRMLLINGSNPGQLCYVQNVNSLIPSRFYSLRMYLTNIFSEAVLGTGENRPNIILRVRDNNNNILASASTGDVQPTTSLIWLPYSLSFTASTTSIKFELVSNAAAGFGNDFALDDIQFFEVIQPVLSTTAVTSACPATSASLAGVTATNQPTSTTLTWHSSATATAANRISDVTALRSGTYYAAFTDGTCFTKTSPFVVLIVPCANPDAGLAISVGTSGTVVANVAANDFVNGQPATLGTNGNATVAQVGTYPAGVTLNTTTGSLSVAAGTAPGSYTVTYQLCDKLSPVNCTTAIATFTVTPVLSGTVFNDANGLTDNAINGTGTNAGGLFAILTDAASGTVVANAVVASTGAYSFTGITPRTYQVRLSTTSATVGSPAPAVSLPAGYTATGEGTAAGGDGTVDGITQVTLTATTSVTGVNFGLDQLPVSTSSTLTAQTNPGGTIGVSIPPASFTGTDPDGTVASIRYSAFPTNTTSLTIGTTAYTSANFPAGGVTAVTGTTVRLDPVDGAVTAVIPFRVIDNAGIESANTASVSVPFTYVVTASPDAGTASAGTGGTAVANVAANDLINGQPATLGNGGNATVAQVGTYPAGITLNTTTGSVSVAQGTTPGVYSLPYQLCDKLSTPTCSTAIISVTVTAASTASPDAGTVSAGAGGTAVANVTANDVVNGQPATLGNGGNATVATVGTYPAGITLNTTTGSISVAQGTTPGSYTVVYQLCDKLSTPTCTTTTAVITVTPSVTATPDAGTVSSGTGGTAVANVAANDIVNGQPATLGNGGNATLATVGTYPTGITLNPATGSISVAQGTTPGSYTVAYQLCDKLTPTTCSTAIVSLTVTSSVVANPDAGLTISAGTSGTVVANVAANDFVNGQPATLGTNGNATVAQVGTYPAGVTLNSTTGSLSVAAGTAPGSYTVTYQLCDKLTPATCSTAIATFTVSPIISGTVFNDANGLTDNQVNGTGTNAGGLFAILTNAASTSVLTSVPVNSSGAYSFTGLTAGTYSVRLSTTSAVVGTTPPPASAPTGYTFTGEGTAAAGDGTPDGSTTVTLTNTASMTGVNFGLDQLPAPTSATLVSQANPGGTIGVSIPPASFTGTDPDGTVASIRYTAFPTNVNSLTIGTTVYTSANFPAGGVTVATGTAVSIDPIDGAVTAAIPFRVIDNASQESTTTGSVSVPFTTLTLSGTVFDDGNGLTDNAINGTGTNAGGLFAILTDAASGTVIASTSVASTGAYSFSALNGGSYNVRLSTSSATVGATAPTPSAPANWVFTGEGTAPAGDGTPNGITSVTLTTASVSGVNFALDQLPTPTSSTLTAQANPGGTNGVSIAPASFAGTDPDGTVASIRYSAFPTNTTSLTIGTTAYTSANFPAGGVTAVTGTTVRLDPVDGAVTAAIPFRVIDNAGVESSTATTASVSVPFTYSILASPDAGTASTGTGGTAVTNVAANDLINGQPATLGNGGNATLAQVGTYPTGITLNTTTGSVSVAQGTAPGSYTVAYQLCDKLTTPTCTTTTAVITVTPSVTASPDAGTVSSGTGGTAVANVAANDVVNGQPATLGNGGNATVATVGTYPAGITLNTTTGSISVAVGTAPGSYTVTYQLCDKLTTPTCTTTTAVITVTPSVTAFPDAGTVSSGTGGTAVANVAANDVVNGQPATLGNGGNATIAQVGTYPTGVTLNTTTGSLSVAAGTAPGSYTVAYQLCDKLTPATCSTAIVSFTVTPGISGTVFDDANGLTDNLVNGTGTNAGGLFAILTNSANTVVSSVSVTPAGTYRFDNVAPGTYSVRLSTTAGTVGSTPPAVSLPTNWTATGEGTAAAGDGTPNGITSVTVASAEVSGVNFALDQLPTPTSSTLTAQANPGGTNGVSIAPASFAGTDPDGTVASIRYTAFPTNTTSLTIGTTAYTSANFPAGGVTVATGTAVAIDPIDGAVTAAIPFRVIDNAGVESTATGSVSVPFTTLTLSGTVFDDGNGLTDNAINGTGTNAGGLFAILTDAASGTVIASTSVASTGAYSFSALNGGSYNVRLSTSSATVGATAPTPSAPANWVFTGEGTAPAGDGTPNGITSVTLTTASVSGVNFALDQLPTPTSATLVSQANPGGLNGVSIPPVSFTGTDPDGTIAAVHYTAFPSNVTSLTIGNAVYVASLGVGLPVGAILFPAGGVTATVGTSVRIDPVDGNVTAVIPFRVIDNAGQESTTTGNLNVPFTGLIVSGTVFDDGNGLTDNTINGTGTNAGGLFVNLVDATGNVAATQSLPTTGVYSFSNVATGVYSVRLSTTTVAVGSAAPAVSVPTGWTFTGEGTAAAGDGTPNGSTQVTLTTASVTGVNFGLDQLPTPTSTTLVARANPGGTNAITIPPSSLTGTDPDGTVASIHYVSFPTYTTTLYIGNTAYTSANFPAGGVTAASNLPVHIDPANDANGVGTSVISFRVVDNAGVESTATATATIPFTCVTTFCPPVMVKKISSR